MTFAYFRRLSSLALRRMVLSFRSPWDGNRCGNPWKSVMALVESSTRTLKSLTLRPCIRPGSIVSDLIRKRYRALETLALTIAPDECDENPFPFAMFPCLRTLAIDLEFLKPLDADVLFRSLALQLRSAADTCPTLRTLEVHALDLTTKFLTQIKPSRTLNDMSATSPITFIFVLQMPYLYEQNMNLDGLFYSAARCVKTWLPAWEERGRLKVVKSQPLQGPWSFR
ncbi:hypothetical protein DL96DRAFT_1607530 [Flagelloscypha sp. PMI_526]|nr:hypothetical protein DL96DRAFT_1607530 [Flagelloscypha sp. PMI_526]